MLLCTIILALHNLLQTVNGDIKGIALKFKYTTIPSASSLAISYDAAAAADGGGDSNFII